MKKDTNIKAECVLASRNKESGQRITTMLVTMPRCILAEFNTHRAFSRNSASSRAIPLKKMRQRVRATPYFPVAWNHSAAKGMQAGEPMSRGARALGVALWWFGLHCALALHWCFERMRCSKEVANRLLEPWLYTTVLVTSTDWLNFFSLRCDSAADPAIQQTADAMLAAYFSASVKEVAPGEWHLPYDSHELSTLGLSDRIEVCVSRAAKLSYGEFDGKIDLAADKRRFQTLLSSGHFSPFEHVAQAMTRAELTFVSKSGNFAGWWQYRRWKEPARVAGSKEASALRNLLEERLRA